jgi:hypothetical protein
MLHIHQKCNQGVINKASTCEKTTKQQAQSSNQGEVRLPQTKDLHQMIQGHEEKGLHEDESPQVGPKAPRNQQQISINVMKITMWNLIQYEV